MQKNFKTVYIACKKQKLEQPGLSAGHPPFLALQTIGSTERRAVCGNTDFKQTTDHGGPHRVPRKTPKERARKHDPQSGGTVGQFQLAHCTTKPGSR